MFTSNIRLSKHCLSRKDCLLFTAMLFLLQICVATAAVWPHSKQGRTQTTYLLHFLQKQAYLQLMHKLENAQPYRYKIHTRYKVLWWWISCSTENSNGKSTQTYSQPSFSIVLSYKLQALQQHSSKWSNQLKHLTTSHL